jgi:hypothetical protein
LHPRSGAPQFRGRLGTKSRNAAISATPELKPGNAQAKPCEHQQPHGRRPLFRGWGWRGRCWHRYPGRALFGVGSLLQKRAKGHHLIGHRWVLGSNQTLPAIHNDHRKPPARFGAMRARSLATCSAELHHQSGRDQRGKLPPLTRQLFVLPFAFTARAVGKVLAFCRPRLEFFSHIKEPTPEQAIALHPCGWIRGGKGRIRDWHDGTQISLATLPCAAAALAL